MTHPFHPFFGREFDLVTYRQNWGEDRVYFHDDQGQLRTLSAGRTSLGADDPFVAVSANRSAFRAVDLLELAGLLQVIQEANHDA